MLDELLLRTPSRRIAAGACTLLAALLVTPFAQANGRFPQATQLVVDPAEPMHVAVRTTFGLLQSNDGGATFRWVCEASAGYAGMIDPPIAIASGGALLVGITAGARRSIDGACNFTKASGLDGYVIDLAVSPADTHRVAAVAAGDGTKPGSQSYAAISLDGGASFASTALLPKGFAPATVELATSDPKRIYVSGTGPDPALGYFERSLDGGTTWTEATFALGDGQGAYIAAVDPSDAERIYLRRPGDFGDFLDVSTDGGASFVNVLAAKGALLGFALSPDGSKLAVGGPADGVWVGKTSDLKLKKVSTIAPRCLTWAGKQLYACGLELTAGFEVGVSVDDGATFTPRFHLWDLTPLDCAAGTTTGASCPAVWTTVQPTLPTMPEMPDGGALDGGGGAGGAGGTLASGGSTGAPVNADGGASGAPSTGGGPGANASAASLTGGGACSAAPGALSRTTTWLIALGAFLAGARARRRKA